jgi:hypothetical protein
MGLSIHYSGTIKNISLIPLLTEEVQDICKVFNWDFHLFDDETFKGICFSPPECEPVFLSFLNNGKLCSPVMLQYDIQPATTLFTKTQFAGIEVHKAIIKLLKHLKYCYFSQFDLMDEGGYWESDDEQVLQKQFAKYNIMLEAVSAALLDLKKENGETAASLADRLEQFLKERWKE